MNKEDVAMIISDSGVITLVIENKPYTVNKEHMNYEKIREVLGSDDYSSLTSLIDVRESIKDYTEGAIEIDGNNVLYKGKDLINPLTGRIIKLMREGLPFDSLVKFLENLMKNPSKTSIDELYLFLEHNLLPITSDGHFLAYKKVTAGYKDCHTRTIDNSVGAKIPPMERHDVCDDRQVTCSDGYHFCSKEYLTSFGGAHVMIVKINPADVVSIPHDYNNSKGRCTWYQVVGECTEEYNQHVKSGNSGKEFDHLETDGWDGLLDGWDDDGYEEAECDNCGGSFDENDLINGECEECIEAEVEAEEAREARAWKADSTLGTKPNGQNFHNVRDSNGRFVKK